MFESLKPEPLHPHLIWRHYPLKPGEFICGYLTGPMIGVATHFHQGRTKPCRHAITKGKLECPFGITCSPRWTGYVPLITVKTRAHVVLTVCRTLGNQIQLIASGSPVRITRPEHAQQPGTVRLLDTSEFGEFERSTMSRRNPDNIWPWLLHLWQDEELTNLYEQQLQERSA